MDEPTVAISHAQTTSAQEEELHERNLTLCLKVHNCQKIDCG
jgi:hypothetical protein